MKIQRTIPPAAAPIAWKDLMRGLTGMAFGRGDLGRLEDEIKDYFGIRHVFLVSSGKAALYLILQALKSLSSRRQVLIPAYTCYSVPSAVLKAGLNLSLVDIDPATLDFDYGLLEKSIDERTLCVVPTHLFGLPSDMDRVNALCKDKGAFVVEDAAQAMGGEYHGKKLGTLGDAAFFSLGRGKNITCGSGGIILTRSDRIADALRLRYSRLEAESPMRRIINLLGVLAMSIWMKPDLYALPASLPFLGLGETKFYTDFPIHRLDGTRAGLLANWKARLEQSNQARLKASGDFIDRLVPGSRVIRSSSGKETVYLRLPVLVESRKAKEELCAVSREKGLGISPMYPTAIQEIRELQGRLESTDFPGAKSVAERLVTLPVHPWVRQKDRDAISKPIEALRSSVSAGNFCDADPSVGKANA
jgi:dTDP-4-amino-4,6-dideoxygalactose transaminase